MAEPARLVSSRNALGCAAQLLADALRAADSARGNARLAIPGGSALRALAPARAQLGRAWARVRLTWVDERCVPFADSRSNRGTALRSDALDASDPPALLLPLLEDCEAPEAAVDRVEAALAARFGGALDVALLGMGADGHIASLFVHGTEPETARVAWIRARSKGAPDRITLTRRMLATAASSILLATGETKRVAIERVLAGDPELPASDLRRLCIVTDLELTASARS